MQQFGAHMAPEAVEPMETDVKLVVADELPLQPA
jgi:hypothetical protein